MVPNLGGGDVEGELEGADPTGGAGVFGTKMSTRIVSPTCSSSAVSKVGLSNWVVPQERESEWWPPVVF